jgi:3-hydroxybutyryl-CoA dehydrogenase
VGATTAPPVDHGAPLPIPNLLRVHGQGPLIARFILALDKLGQSFVRMEDSDWIGLEVATAQLRLTDGRTATQIGTEVAVFDLPLNAAQSGMLAWAPSLGASAAWAASAPSWLDALGFTPQRIADAPGLVVARTVAMLINEAADAVQQGVCTAEGANAAMKLGVNYPAGPFEWLAGWRISAVVQLLDALDHFYRGERYRVSPWLRQASPQAPNQ